MAADPYGSMAMNQGFAQPQYPAPQSVRMPNSVAGFPDPYVNSIQAETHMRDQGTGLYKSDKNNT
jgi:hypothetical protein